MIEANRSRDSLRLKSDNLRRGCRLQDGGAVQGRSESLWRVIALLTGGRLGGEKGTREERQIRNALYFINHLSARHGHPWNCTKTNFTVGARGSLKQSQFQDRLRLLRVTNSKARKKIRALTVSKTLALSDIILKLVHVSILRSHMYIYMCRCICVCV